MTTIPGATRRGFLVGACSTLAFPAATSQGSAASGPTAKGGSSIITRCSAALPPQPRRVIALEFLLAETLALLDLPPVGMSDPSLYPGWLGVAVDKLKDVASVGTRQQPSLEAIARLEPDLILGVTYRHAPLFDIFEQIAPTVLLEFAPGKTKDTQVDAVLELLDFLARVTKRKDLAGPVRAACEEAFTHDGARLEQAGRIGRRLVLLQELPLPDTYWVFTADSMAAGVARRLGLAFWPEQRTRDGVRLLRSEELLALDNVDIGLVSFTGPEIGLEAKTSSIVWAHAPAKRSGRVSLIERNIWNFGGPGSAIRLSNAITQAVVNAPPRS